jgi:hypothetical protein
MKSICMIALASAVAFAGMVGESITLQSGSAEAAVCARGVYRAGCAGPRGAVAVRRAPVPRRAVIVR